MKKILLRIFGISFGLACDAALIHNFFWQDRWNRYCDNYITLFEVYSWVGVFALVINIIWLITAAARSDFLRQNLEHAKKNVETGGDLCSKIYFFVNSLPMLFFVWVFVGDVSLGIVWGLCALLQVFKWQAAKEVRKKLADIDDPGKRLADLLNSTNLN